MRRTANAVGAFEAKTKLSELLDRVSRGEEITITRHEKAVARLVPVTRPSAGDIREAFQRMDQIRTRAVHASTGKKRLSYRQFIEEGRRR